MYNFLNSSSYLIFISIYFWWLSNSWNLIHPNREKSTILKEPKTLSNNAAPSSFVWNATPSIARALEEEGWILTGSLNEMRISVRCCGMRMQARKTRTVFSAPCSERNFEIFWSPSTHAADHGALALHGIIPEQNGWDNSEKHFKKPTWWRNRGPNCLIALCKFFPMKLRCCFIALCRNHFKDLKDNTAVCFLFHEHFLMIWNWPKVAKEES